MQHVWKEADSLGLEEAPGQRYRGDILFLEDDLELSDDFPTVLRVLVKQKNQLIPQTTFKPEVGSSAPASAATTEDVVGR